MTVFNLNKKKSSLNSPMFFDPQGGIGLQRYDILKYQQFDKLTDKQLGFFWRPAEVDILRDAKDFKDLTEYEQHIFTSNLKRQTLLDSVQGRSPSLALLPIVGLPELEAWIITWSFNETIHSRSYTHIIRNIYPDPSVILDGIVDIKEILELTDSITKYYDELIEAISWYNLLGVGQHIVQSKTRARTIEVSINDLKKKLWLCLMSINALEGVRFYVSFACSWAFAELKKMEGNAKIIKLICRDENLHLAATQSLLKMLIKEDSAFEKIRKETQEECTKMFIDVVDQEKTWTKYLFQGGSMIGLNEQLLNDYVEWIANKRMQAIGLNSPYKTGSNPLPWTTKWIAGSEVQVAPQETEISSYIIGSVKQDVTEDTFKGFNL